MIIDKRTITTHSGIVYEVDFCQRALLKLPEESPEYVFFLKIWVALARKASNMAYEGEVFKV